MTRFILYRIYDASGVLLYVGATTKPSARVHTHSVTQPWWDDAARIDLQHFGALDELNSAERAAIESEKPRHNVLHSGKPAPWTKKPRRPHGDGSICQRADGTWVASVEARCGPNGERRRRQASSKHRDVAEKRLAELLAEKRQSQG